MEKQFAQQLIATTKAWLATLEAAVEAGEKLPKLDVDTLIAMNSVDEPEEEVRAAKVELLRRYRPVNMSDMQTVKHQGIRAECQILANSILGICPKSPERDRAMEKVEEAMFWANEAIARRSPPISTYRPLKVGETRRG
jgi:hypothetical protein